MRIYSELNLAAIALAINLITVGTLVAATLAVAFKAAPGMHPRARYLIGLVAFFMAALWPILAALSPAPPEQIRVLVPAAGSSPRTTPATTEAGKDPAVRLADYQERPSPGPRRDGAGRINELAARLGNAPPATGFLCLWLIVSAALLLREAVGHARSARRRRSWRAADARLREAADWPSDVALYSHTDGNVGPFTAGLFRAAVVIPEDTILKLSRHEIRCVARHELAHARWRDPLVNAVLRAARALLWPGLPLWHLERVIKLEREAAADHAAVGDARTSQRVCPATEYAGLLLSIARWEAAAARLRRCGVISRIAGESDLEARVRRLLAPPPRLHGLRLSIACSLVFAGALATTLLPLASGPVTAGGEQHGGSDPASADGHTPAPSSRTAPPAGRVLAEANAARVYSSFVRESQSPRSAPRRQNAPPEAGLSAPPSLTPRPPSQSQVRQAQHQVSRESLPPPGALAPGDLASVNERMNRERTARQNEEAARELPARNAAWTAKQNAEAARTLPARNAAWTAEQNAAAARELPSRNAEIDRALTAARDAAAPRTGPRKE